MTGSVNLALLSPQQRQAMQADLLACRIRSQLGSLKGAQRQEQGRALLSAVPSSLQAAVVEQLKARAK